MADNLHAWTVSIIAQYDSNDPVLVDAYCELEASILSQKQNNLVRYFIFFYDQNENLAYIKHLKLSYYNIYQFHIIYHFEKNNFDFYDGHAIKYFLKEFSNKNLHISEDVSMHHLMLTWGHGTGYGFFPKKIPNTKEILFVDAVRVSEQIKFLKAQFSITNNFIQEYIYPKLPKEFLVCMESLNLDNEFKTISITQLQEIIHSSIGCIDILLTMNCYMQTLEAGYILKEVVELMIAPQTLITFYGYNFRKLFGLLHEKPESELSDIARNISNYYLIKFAEEPILSKTKNKREAGYYNQVVFSAITLKGYNVILPLIDEIASYMIKNFNNELKEKCLYARNNIYSAIGRNTKKELAIDFRQFFIEFCKLQHEQQYIFKLKPLQKLLLNMRKSYMPAILQPGVAMENDISLLRLPSIGAQFFSIFFPKSNTLIDLSTNRVLFGYQQIHNSKWIEFLCRLYN